MNASKQTVLICSYLEPEHVERIRQVDNRLVVIYEPVLLRPPRYAADHTGDPAVQRTPEQEQRWRGLLAQANILFDFDPTHRPDLPDLAPNARWVQATSAGIGQMVKTLGYDTRMPNTIFTTASGVHPRPLAEFVVMAMLVHYKGALHMIRQQGRKHWERYAGTDLLGRTLGIVGLGRVGAEIARMCRGLGMTVIGSDVTPAPESVDRYYDPAQLHTMLRQPDVLVVIVPHTPQTEKMIGGRELALLPRGAYFINIARGAVVDESALIEALRSGHLSGAALDVFAEEPLPPESPLWEMPNVLVSPHSASTSDRENGRITALFCDNLRRFLNGEPLRNVLNTDRMY
ncbi:MAG TPA: D-2-hydroxyacid dehydrogenase [Candidatus Methylomirabilis sp.]|nr:D-2-hydroxyacid dehydrogenase [Candidatus Methylomirabilis sp.]